MSAETLGTYTELTDPRRPVGPTKWSTPIDSQGLPTDGYGSVESAKFDMPGDASDTAPLQAASRPNDGHMGSGM